jgi:glycosyltransferase involved in cell wall biosynthesis
VLHVPFCYFPEAVGGTEIYVRDLAREQSARGDRVMILAPGESAQSYQHDGLPVHRFTVSNQIRDVRDLYSSGQTNTIEFLGAVRNFRPDVLHVHGVGRGIVPDAIAQLKRAGVAIVLTYHTPTTTCIRGTLLQHGAHPCDGALNEQRCTACTLTAHGVPSTVAIAIAKAPVAASSIVRATRLRGRWVTALRMRELVALRHAQARSILELADQIVAPAQWARALLERLGVAREKITLSRQGIRIPIFTRPARSAQGGVRVVYVGRLEPAKGLHLLTRALRAEPSPGIELHIYGVVQNDSHRGYRRDLLQEAARDHRITVHDAVAPDEIVPTIAQYDVLAAPSQQLETGPLVVLEAFAAGLPVLGSRLGGIAELVEHEVNGLLIEPGRAAAWSEAFSRLLGETHLLEQLRAGVQPPRTIEQVADDMAAVYAQVLAA